MGQITSHGSLTFPWETVPARCVGRGLGHSVDPGEGPQGGTCAGAGDKEGPAFAGPGLREGGGPSLHPSFLPGPICLLKLLRCPSRKLCSCCPFPLPASLLFLCFYHPDSCRPGRVWLLGCVHGSF